MFQNNVIAGASGQGGSDFYLLPIDQSLRFNDNDSAYLARTPSTAGNSRTWTWSAWVKKGNLGNAGFIWSAGPSGTNNHQGLQFTSADKLNYTVYGVGGQATTAVFRDPSAWYHVVLVVDTTQATFADRLKLYVNGVEQATTGQTLFAQNYQTKFNTTTEHRMGKDYTGAYFDGYLAEVNFIDGQALDADSFGEFKSGVWVPKAYTGTYGTNGFHLDFGNSAAIGDDISGNNNDWTANNLAASDVVLDSPTNNFATFNAIAFESNNFTLSQGNLKQNTATTQTYPITGSTIVLPKTKKWYAEFYYYRQSVITGNVGVCSTKVGSNNEPTTSYAAGVAGSASGTIFGLLWDADNRILKTYKNNTLVDTSPAQSDIDWVFFVAGYTSGDPLYWVANFGQDSSFAGLKTAQGNTDANGIGDFYYSPPAGYLALCTANLPEPAFSPANDESPQDHFNTVLYTGNSGTQSITGVGFQPDFLWIKNRSNAYNHTLTDAIRGSGIRLYSNTTNAEINTAAYQSFEPDGFSLNSITSDQELNYSGMTYVAWNWKANGSGVSNTDGSITSTVSANTEAGFSIVSFNVPTASDAHTAGHGLNQKPDIVIGKSRVNSFSWWTLTDIIDGSNDYLALNSTAAKADDTVTSGSTSTAIPAANAFWGTGEAIAYCFHSVDGFSKFGSYTGNGSTDGSFVYTGFRPAFVITKRTDATSNWTIWDSERDSYNVAERTLFPNSSSAEESGNAFEQWDLLSNGFKLRSNGRANVSGGTYIFMAFAENPFKYSNAR